jgi:type IV secretory pathway VirB3-like protein
MILFVICQSIVIIFLLVAWVGLSLTLNDAQDELHEIKWFLATDPASRKIIVYEGDSYDNNNQSK